jgi:hypothetical protein
MTSDELITSSLGYHQPQALKSAGLLDVTELIKSALATMALFRKRHATSIPESTWIDGHHKKYGAALLLHFPQDL